MIDLGPVDDLPVDTPYAVDTPAGPVLVARLGEGVHAVSDVCPHRGTRLSGGVVRDGTVTCPGHWWRFDLRDGSQCGHPPGHPRSPDDDTRGVATYAVVVDGDGRAWLHVPEPVAAQPVSMRERLLAAAREQA